MFDWSDYLELSRQLVGESGATIQEARQRCAISRAYYAAFCRTMDYLVNHGTTMTGTGDDHRFIQDRLRVHGRRGKYISSLLSSMRVDRNLADYDNEFPGVAKAAMDTIRDAEFVIAEIARLPR
ncbi:MAG TPA: DNA-binding protein [Armatimonadota bacterium]|nr:DNA-binding protein [Armatimonadota bacterium]